MKSFNNVEGKVNNVAFQYLKKKELEKYIRKVNIKYIVNYEELLPYVQFMQENIIASGRKDVIVNKYNKSVPISLLHVPYNDH